MTVRIQCLLFTDCYKVLQVDHNMLLSDHVLLQVYRKYLTRVLQMSKTMGVRGLVKHGS